MGKTCECGHHEAVHRAMCGAPEGCGCNRFREAAPEPLVIPVQVKMGTDWWVDTAEYRITFTPDTARRLYAMAQEPTR